MSHDPTTTPGAFHGSAAVKSEVITRLQRGIEAAALTPTEDHEWNPERATGSITGLCSRAKDRAGYERVLGWPYVIGATHETLMRITQQVQWPSADGQGSGPPPRVALDAALLPDLTAWLAAVRPGQDLRWALPAFQRRLTEALTDGLPLLGAASPVLRPLLAEWRQMQESATTVAADASAWQALRSRALALAQLSRGSDKIVSTLIEAMAWPPEDDSVDWIPAWRMFLSDAARLNLDQALDPQAAELLRAQPQAWEALQQRAEHEPLLEIFTVAESDPSMAALETPEMQGKLEAALRGHARPLLQALLALFATCVSDAAAPAGATSAATATPRPEVCVVQIGGPDDFQSQVLDAAMPVLVDFWAPWCSPCVQFMPVLHKLAADYAGRVRFVKVNVDEQEELSRSFNIRAVPSLLVFQNGEAVERIMALSRSRSRSRIEAVLDARILQK